MKITVQSIHFNADQKLLEFIQKKVDKLDQFFDQIISGEVYLKLENVDDEANKISEIKLIVPGVTMFAKEQCKTFEEATDLAIESLRKQITKHKDKTREKLSEHKAILNANEVSDYQEDILSVFDKKVGGTKTRQFFLKIILDRIKIRVHLQSQSERAFLLKDSESSVKD